MNRDEIVRKIRDFADVSHGEQTRKYTEDRYIVHPLRVMEICRGYTESLPVLAAALLHDVLEDTPVNVDEMTAFLGTLLSKRDQQETVKLVIELTDVYVKEDYPQWNRKKRKEMEVERLARVSHNAQTIKYADILDNSMEILEHDRSFGLRFLKECRAILKTMVNGNRALRERALQQVNAGLRSYDLRF